MEQDRVNKLSDHGKNVWSEADGARKTMAQLEQRESFGQRWAKIRPTKAIVFWSWLAVSILTMMVGFNWGGWVTGGTAQKMADVTAKNAAGANFFCSYPF